MGQRFLFSAIYLVIKTNDIRFNKPSLVGKEFAYIEDAVARGQLSGDGYYTKKCQKWLEVKIGSLAALITHSCTAALEMAAILCDLKPGDEVIMPSFTFVSTANAVALRGATPVFIDIRSDTLNINPSEAEDAVTEKTKAIFVVHYAGVVAEMNDFRDIADRHGLLLVEDAAQALGSSYHGAPAGSFGDLAAFSFHETKNVISGEGGALIINNPDMIERAEIIREKGTNRSQFFRGQVDKYSWVDIGSSFLPGELIAAFLYAQMEMEPEILARRMALWDTYHSAFSPLAEASGFATPSIPPYCDHNAHMYYLLLSDADVRQNFIQDMGATRFLTEDYLVFLN